jgi:putative sterol carrier protein
MRSVSDEFFKALDGRHEPLLEHATGTVRFDITDADTVRHRYVRISHGDVLVEESADAADCVVATTGGLLDGVGRGEVNAMAAYLRGELTAAGDLELLVLFQRVFPRPGEAVRG